MKKTINSSLKLLLLVLGIIIISHQKSYAQSWSTSGDTISSLGYVKATNLNITGSVLMKGLVSDTATDLLAISKQGNVNAIKGLTLSQILYPLIQAGPCDSTKPLWYQQHTGSNALVTKTCTWVGVGEAGIGGFPDAPLSVSNSSVSTQFSIVNPTSLTDVFTIGKTGNTYISGLTGIGVAPSSLTTLNIAGIHGQYTTLISTADTSNTYNIMSEFTTTNSGSKIGLAVHIAAGSQNYDVFDVFGNGNTLFGGYLGNTNSNLPLQIGTNNNRVSVGGSGSILTYSSPGFVNPIEGYIGFNLYSNGSGTWQSATGADGNSGGAAILADDRGYMNFVCSIAAPSGLPDATVQGSTAMVVSPHGVLIRNLSMNGSLDPAVAQVAVGSQYVFFVGGSMVAQELLIQPCAGVWCDYVFDKKYKLTPLYDLEKYIIANKHLPDVPSAAEVKDSGIKVAEMDAAMLKKIEELTLYVIQQQKQIDAMSDEIAKLKGKLQ